MKKSKKIKLRSNEPHNYNYWRWVLQNENEVQEFINRGDTQQHDLMLHSLLYTQGKDEEFFKKINGKEILKQLKEKIK